MRFLILLTFTVVFLASPLPYAADPQLAKQIADFQQQITFLHNELSLQRHHFQDTGRSHPHHGPTP